MYKAVAQLVIFYGIKRLVVMGYMLKVPEGFHHQAVRQITGMTAKYSQAENGSNPWQWRQWKPQRFTT